jgi:hypothetical protein
MMRLLATHFNIKPSGVGVEIVALIIARYFLRVEALARKVNFGDKSGKSRCFVTLFALSEICKNHHHLQNVSGKKDV